LDRGDDAWHRRGQGFAGTGSVDPAPARAALAAYEAAFRARPDDPRVRFKLIEALYFEAWFTSDDEYHQRRTWDRILSLTEELIAATQTGDAEGALGGRSSPSVTAGDEAEAHFWSAVAWGLYGMSHSKLKAAAKGVAERIRTHASRVIEIDPGLWDGGGYRLLGRLHTATPKVPLVTGWLDRDEGIELLERACEVSTDDPRNPYFLADALLRHRPRERDRGLELLREVVAREPAPDRIVEDSETLADAAATLAHWQRRLEQGR
ncbi:MAG: hypothetical protein R3190_15470, partial [Thermoanaerobaculia bacterium]|nr:hypothetical protein [Thermoanaerobaculia bacterium]